MNGRWMELAQDCVIWWKLVLAVLNFRVMLSHYYLVINSSLRLSEKLLGTYFLLVFMIYLCRKAKSQKVIKLLFYHKNKNNLRMRSAVTTEGKI